MNISIVIPVGTEENHEIYHQIYDGLHKDSELELVWVSANLTLNKWLESKNQRVIEEKGPNRAYRLNIGIRAASFEHIILHHPRSILAEGAIGELKKTFMKNSKAWGGFTHRFFDSSHYLMKFTSWYSNRVRFDLKGIIYLDHCFYFNKRLIGDNPYVPEVDIFEDTLLSDKLNKLGPPTRLSSFSSTSAIRFNKNGTWKQALMNQKLKLAYLFKTTNDKEMNKTYEKDLWLN